MTKCPRLSLNRPRHRRSRWIGAAVLIVGVHISGVAIGMMKWEDPIEPPAMPPAVMIDMLPPAAPAQQPGAQPPSQQQPAKEPEPVAKEEPVVDIPDAEIPPEPELSEFLPPPPPEVVPEVELAPKVEKKKKKETEQVAKKTEKKPEKKLEKKPEKKPEKKIEKPKEQPKTVSAPPAPPSPAPVASAPPSPAVGSSASQEAGGAAGKSDAAPAGQTASQMAAAVQAKANWEGLLAAHINQYKKYPAVAKRRNKTGSPEVWFRIDRGGNVQEVKLVNSSGVDSLDEEAMDVFWRATPLPPLPSEISGSVFKSPIQIDFTLND